MENPICKNRIKKIRLKSEGTWTVHLANLNLVNDEFSFDDEGKKPITNAVDYAHLLIRNLNTTASGLSLSSENYKGEIKMLSFSEKSGFELKSLSTGFYYSDQQASVNNLILLTNQYESEKQFRNLNMHPSRVCLKSPVI